MKTWAIELAAWMRGRALRLFRIRTLGSLAIAVDEQRRIVLVRQAYRRHEWHLPGGGLKRDESFREAAIREAREETGLHLDADARVIMQSVHRRLMGGGWVDHVAVFALQGWTLEPNSTWEIAEVRLFPVDDLPANLQMGHKRRIDEWLGKAEITDTW